MKDADRSTTATYLAPAILSMLYAWYGLDVGDLTAILMTVASVLVTFVCIAANFGAVGHGVDGRIHIAKVPLKQFIVYLAVFATGMIPLCMPHYTEGYHAYPSLFLNGIGMSFILGGAAGLCHWYFYAYYITYFSEEGIMRVSLAYRGKSLAEIDMKVEIARRYGFFGPE